MEKTMIIWRFTDGKLGHENQTSGLVAALGDRENVRVFDIRVDMLPSARRLLLNALFRKKIKGFPAELPDLLIGAGRKTHIPMVIAKSQCGGKSLVLMRPSIPMGLFDLVVAPMHDNVPQRKNVIDTNGVLNAVQFEENKNPNRGLILIGGESPHYVWDDKEVANQIKEIVATDHNVEWTLTTSRRTPESFLQFLQQVQIQIVPVEKTDQEWMSEHYAESGKIWVTPDSVSMVYEALTSGAVTKVFSLEPKSNESRVRKGLEVLIHNESVQSFELWKQGSNKQCSPIHFNESARIADHILEQLL
jgi:mitochondrial fission protein ELM1